MNVFAFASVLLSVVSNTPTVSNAASLLMLLLAACAISLTPDQAAFFLASQDLAATNTIPTAAALAKKMAILLNQEGYPAERVIDIAAGLQAMRVPLDIGNPPNYVIRH